MFCPIDHRVTRRAALGMLVGFCGAGTLLRADDARRGRFPFAGPPASLDEFFDRMFPPEAPEDDDELAHIEVSVQEERQYGRRLVDAYTVELKRQKLRTTGNGKDASYVQALVEALRPLMTQADRYPDVRVVIVDSSVTDARTFPGGTIFVFRGLLDQAGSEAALVAVLGHELSHLDRGHLVLPLKRSRLLNGQGAKSGQSLEKMLGDMRLVSKMFARPFRPQDETVADQDGVDWAYRLGYDPRELARLFARLQARDGQIQIPGLSLFRTHPYHVRRHDAVLARFEELQAADPREGLYVGERNLKVRTPRSVREFSR